MSEPKKPTSDRKAHYLELPSVQGSRREMLQILSALGAATMVPSLAKASDPPPWTVIPHGEVIEMALTDPAYRAMLLANPKATLVQENGLNFPPSVKVIVVQDTLEQIHVVLSSKPKMRGEELGVVGEILTAYRTQSAFRAAMLEDPKGAFEAWTGAVVPDALHVVAVEETPARRVIQLPAQGTLDLQSLAEVRAVWGEAETVEEEDGWWGGGNPSPPEPTTTVTITSGQICNCWSLGSKYESQAPNCCFEMPEPETEPL